MVIEQLTFTAVEPGKGLDPRLSGYQIQACSAGLDKETRDLLADICIHYGDVVYRQAPAAAREAETVWRRQAERLTAVPDDILAQFPPVWSYLQLDETRYALTQTRYRGLTYDRRLGNFFCHVLVLTANDLAAYEQDPFLLAQTLWQQPLPNGRETTLPTLTALPNARQQRPSYKQFSNTPYGEQLAMVLTALCQASTLSRPVLLCLEDWQKGMQILALLFSLLPPPLRAQTTFCSYEGDRSWKPARLKRNQGSAAAHHLLLICDQRDQDLQLRPDEYQSRFAIFNFVSQQYSELPETSPLARLAATAVQQNNPATVQKYHELGEKLELGADVGAWNRAVAMTALLREQATVEELTAGIAALNQLTAKAAHLELILDKLLARVQAMVNAQDTGGLRSLAHHLASLVNQLPVDGKASKALQQLAENALLAGDIALGTELLQACGASRESFLLEWLGQCQKTNQWPQPKTAENRRQWVELLLQGLQFIEAAANSQQMQTALWPHIFCAANDAGMGADVWHRLGKANIQPHLSESWSGEKEKLTRALLDCLPPDECPEAVAWLRLRQLQETKPTGKMRTALVTAVSYAAARTTIAESLFNQIEQEIAAQVTEPTHLALLKGLMAEAGWGTAVTPKLLTSYQKTTDTLLKKERNHVRHRLAKENAVELLCHELNHELLPWDPDAGPNLLQSWQDVVLNKHPQVLEHLCQQLAIKLENPTQKQALLPLAEALLAGLAGNTAPPVLYDTVIRARPLTPLRQQQAGQLPKGIAADVQARWRVQCFMGEVEQAARQADWSLLEFPQQDSVWQEDVAALPRDEKETVITWFLQTVEQVGVTDTQEARYLLKLLKPLMQLTPQNIAQAVQQLLAGRDPVTWVQVATTFADCSLRAKKPEDKWGQLVGALLPHFDKNTRRLFVAHLNGRFVRWDQEYEARLAHFCTAAGLEPPVPEQKADTTPTGKKQDDVKRPLAIGGLLKDARRYLHKFTSSDDDTT